MRVLSSWAAIQEEFFLDCLATILRKLCNYLPVNIEYYSRRIKSLTSMAAGCFDTANRRRTEYISLCANLAVRLFHIDLLHLLLKIASERKADPASDILSATGRNQRFCWLQQQFVVNLTVRFFHKNLPGATDRDNLEIENGLRHRWNRALLNRITLLLWRASWNPRAAKWLSPSLRWCSTSYSNCMTQNLPWKAGQQTFVL